MLQGNATNCTSTAATGSTDVSGRVQASLTADCTASAGRLCLPCSLSQLQQGICLPGRCAAFHLGASFCKVHVPDGAWLLQCP